ncbi:MAG: hypothetical protein KIT22_17290, partial [Verrucomicrobiae bacterium]|nr:hypothetical protein [Verrucomicrobiae bacterium]
MAVASRTDGMPNLFKLEDKAESLSPMSWPVEWEALRENLSRKGNPSPSTDDSPPSPGSKPRDRPPGENFDRFREPGNGPRGDRKDRNPGRPGSTERRSPSFIDSGGVLFEFPIFAGRGGGEHGWLILELDLDYTRGTWLPELVREYLDPNDRRMNDIRVSVIGERRTPLFTTSGAEAPASFKVASEFNRQGRNEVTARGLPRRATWLFEASHRPGVLEAVVAASRRRNLAIAILINIFVLTAGGLLLHYTRRSRQLGEAQVAFVANVSHELRTPLTVIRGAAHNLKKGIVPEPERVEEYGKLIARHAEDLSEMVEQVLSFAATKKLAPASLCQPVVVSELLREALAAAEPDIQAAHCELETDIEEALPMINGDPSTLGRAFRNLIANAAKHGGSGGWIGVKARAIPGATPCVEIE